MSETVHVTPLDDLIEHVLDDECICGPAQESVPLADGSTGWVVVHHSLDGRERRQNAQLAIAPMRVMISAFTGGFETALKQLGVAFEQLARIVRKAERRSGPPSLAIDGTAYRRRTRRRKR